MDLVEEVRSEVLSIPEKARLIIVRNQEGLELANQQFLIIKGLRKKIADVFEPIISKAFAAHKEAVAQRKKAEEPLILAESWLNIQVTEYHKIQERKRREEEERARIEAIKKAEEERKRIETERLAQAAELERVGAIDEANGIIAEAMEDIDKPLEVYVPPPETPKVKLAGATMKSTWTFEVINEALIPRQYLMPDAVKIGGVVRSLKSQANIPGIKVIENKSMVATGR